MSNQSHKRRNYLIKKRFQLKYTLAIASTILVIMLVSGAALYVGIWGSIIENFSKFKVSENLENIKRITDYEAARYQKGDFRLEKIFREAELLSMRDQETLHAVLASVNRSLVPKVIILIALISLGAIFVSHKIAGPMYRIEKSAEAIAAGDLRVNFHIRRNDEMKETASVLEEMVESLHDDIAKLRAAVVLLEERIRTIAPGVRKEDGDALLGLINDIDGILAKYKT